MSLNLGAICQDDDAAMVVNDRLFASQGSDPPNSRPAVVPGPSRPTLSSTHTGLIAGARTQESCAPQVLPVRGSMWAGLAPQFASVLRYRPVGVAKGPADGGA